MRTSVASAVLLALGLADAVAVVPKPLKVDYSGFRGLRVTLNEHTQEVEDKLTELVAHILNPGAEVLDVVVDPANIDAVTNMAASAEVIIDDVGALLAEEEHAAPLATRAVPAESWFTAYHSYNDHLQFLRDLQGGFTSNSAIVTAGTSAQGKTLTGIQIWGSGGRGSKPAIVIHGTVHAREWISTMTTEYIAWQLLTKYSSDAAVKALVDKFDFYITPIVNPDGFAYTQTNDRLWRKNRQTVSGNSCVGRDINRNWPSSSWAMTGGASTSPCSETYKGQAAGDSPENKGLVAQAQSLRSGNGIRLYLDIHSYGQYILWRKFSRLFAPGYLRSSLHLCIYVLAAADRYSRLQPTATTATSSTLPRRGGDRWQLLPSPPSAPCRALPTPSATAAAPCTRPRATAPATSLARRAPPTPSPTSSATPATSASRCPPTRSSPPSARPGRALFPCCRMSKRAGGIWIGRLLAREPGRFSDGLAAFDKICTYS
ncbi:hypothetical protein RB601_002988 [Gaeumannomyces tritici]